MPIFGNLKFKKVEFSLGGGGGLDPPFLDQNRVNHNWSYSPSYCGFSPYFHWKLRCNKNTKLI